MYVRVYLLSLIICTEHILPRPSHPVPKCWFGERKIVLACLVLKERKKIILAIDP